MPTSRMLPALAGAVLIVAAAASLPETAGRSADARAPEPSDYEAVVERARPCAPAGRPAGRTLEHALALTAASARYHATRRRSDLDLARRCGAAVLAGRDAGGGRTLPTALAVKAMLDWAAVDAGAPRARLHAAVARAVTPYLGGTAIAPDGLPLDPPADLTSRRPVTAGASVLAGQLQRLASVERDPLRRSSLRAVARGAVRALLLRRRLTASGHWYWPATAEGDEPNRLDHAVLLVGGLRSYRRWGGRLPPALDWEDVVAHLLDFVAPEKLGFRDRPRTPFDTRPADAPPSAAGTGLALAVAAHTRELRFLTPLAWRDARAALRGAAARGEAGHLLLGLAEHLATSRVSPSGPPFPAL